LKGWAQILSAALAALVSGFLILGSLVITLVENAGDPSLGVSTAAGRTTGTAESPADENAVEAPAESPSPAPTLLIPSVLSGTSIPPALSTPRVSPSAMASISPAATQVSAYRTQTPEDTLHAAENPIPGYPVLTELGATPSAAPEK
jgi:hypothetical protein